MPRIPSRRLRSDAAAEAARPGHAAVVTYARVSSKDQEREGFSIPAQQRLLNDYARAHGMEVVRDFVDVETAKRAGRTNFTAMLAWLKRNKQTCRTLLVEKTDRLYRNLKDWVVLDEMDIEIHLVKEGGVVSDTARSADKFMHGIRVLMAKNYIDNLREETTKGMNEKAMQGIWPTRAPFGYRNAAGADGKRHIEPDPDRASIVARLFERAATSDASLTLITKELRADGVVGKLAGAPITRSRVHAILHNPIYAGEVVWRGRRTAGVHKPLVSRDLFDSVQERLTDRYQGQRDTEHVDTFAYLGLITCGHCGCALTAEIHKSRYIYYHCTGYKGRCDEPWVREEVLTEAFADHLAHLVLPPDLRTFLADELRASQKEQQVQHYEAVTRLQGEVAKLQARVDAAYVDKLDGHLDTEAWRRLTEQWNETIRTHRRTIARHEDAKRSYLEEGIQLLEVMSEAADLFRDATTAQRRKLLNGLFSNSAFAHGMLSVDWVKPFVYLAQFHEEQKAPIAPKRDSEDRLSCLVTSTGFEPVLPG